MIDDFCADHLYRIAQEAVSDAVRHSGCSRIRIALRRTEPGLLLEIQDDGGDSTRWRRSIKVLASG